MSDSLSEVQLITGGLFDDLIEKARQSPRRRMNHNFHANASDNPHRFLNVFLRGSYVTPHRHLYPPKAESFLVLEGWMAAWTFEDDGRVRSAFLLGQETPPASLPQQLQNAPVCRGIDVPPGVWHTVAAITAHAVCFEVKPGPWEPATDKEFAPWAPREGSAEGESYLAGLTGPAGLAGFIQEN